MSSDVFAIAVAAGVDPPAARAPAHRSGQRLPRIDGGRFALRTAIVHDLELSDPAATDTDDLATTEPSAPDHVHDDLTTTQSPAPDHVHDRLTTTATTIASTTTNHDQNPFRHWHPPVPFPGAAVTGTAEAARAAPC